MPLENANQQTGILDNPLFTAAVGQMWTYLSSWLSDSGGVNGPVVHRANLKRMRRIHDTPWTQAAVIEGLLNLYRNSSNSYWLEHAIRLGHAQCDRLSDNGSFKWAGHEDDRFSSLVHNALADCALMSILEMLAATSQEHGSLRERYTRVVATNIDRHLMGRLYRPELGGFKVNHPHDFYADGDRFVVNMNSVAAETLLRFDRLRGTSGFSEIAAGIGERILEHQVRSGPFKGAYAYADNEPDTFVTIYSALTMRGLPYLYRLTGDQRYMISAENALSHLEYMRDQETDLWIHQIREGRRCRYPVFVAGAGMVAEGARIAAGMAGREPELASHARALLRYQMRNGAIRNFIGYQSGEYGSLAKRADTWEDVFPTPNWNAQAFQFISGVTSAPEG